MKTKDFNLLQKYILGRVNIDTIWHEEVSWLFQHKQVKRVYEIYKKGLLDTWYLIIDKGDCNYIVKHNNVNPKVMMNPFISNFKNVSKIEQSYFSNYCNRNIAA